jgi:hypothetical protein
MPPRQSFPAALQLTVDFRLGVGNGLNENEPYLYRAVDDGFGYPVETVRMQPTERTCTFTTSIKV